MMLRNIVSACLLAIPLAFAATMPGAAGSSSFCISCVDPDRTYVCRVETPKNDPGPGALQFYCIVRTAREEGHKSCAVTNAAGGICSGIEKTYTYNGPALPPEVQAKLNNQASPASPAARPAASAPVPLQPPPSPAEAEKDGPPETLVEMGARAGQAARQGLRATGSAVRNAAGTTSDAMRNAAGTTGDAVKNAAQETGEVARESGSRVSGAARSVSRAARTAFGCVWSLFKDCGTDTANQP